MLWCSPTLPHRRSNDDDVTTLVFDCGVGLKALFLIFEVAFFLIYALSRRFFVILPLSLSLKSHSRWLKLIMQIAKCSNKITSGEMWDNECWISALLLQQVKSSEDSKFSHRVLQCLFCRRRVIEQIFGWTTAWLKQIFVLSKLQTGRSKKYNRHLLICKFQKLIWSSSIF